MASSKELTKSELFGKLHPAPLMLSASSTAISLNVSPRAFWTEPSFDRTQASRPRCDADALAEPFGVVPFGDGLGGGLLSTGSRGRGESEGAMPSMRESPDDRLRPIFGSETILAHVQSTHADGWREGWRDGGFEEEIDTEKIKISQPPPQRHHPEARRSSGIRNSTHTGRRRPRPHRCG